jgi:hypothetical protein
MSSVTIPDRVTNIAGRAFSYCTSLTSVIIPNSVTSIGDYSFYSCTNLTSITMGNSVISIGDSAFDSDTSLTSVTIPNSVTSIGTAAFGACTSLSSATIPDSVTNIGSDAFLRCTSLTSVTIGDGVTSIAATVFYLCTGLTNVTIPNSVTNIGDYAFSSCSNLTSITIPNSVTSIGEGAFYSCTSLASVTIPDRVTNIGRYAFIDCIRLTAINVETNNPAYSSVSGALLNQSQTTLIQYPGGKVGSYSIPNSVTSIEMNAFRSDTNLTILTIPINVTNIGQLAFSSCSSLASVFFMGNAPSAAIVCGVDDCYSIFDGDNATVYYLPGTSGWGPTFARLPTAVWTLPYPLILNNGLAVRSNQFGFTVSWATNALVVVEASTDLNNPKWSPVITNPLSGGTFYFTDPQWTNYPSQFYRVRSQ